MGRLSGLAGPVLALLGGFAGFSGCALEAPVGPDLPSQPVEIRIDGSGVPHIYGATDADAFYGAGYQMAVDRLFAMDLMRRRALGRRAEVLGADLVDGDKLARLLDFARLGEQDADLLAREAADDFAMLDAWVRGVNRRIDEVVTSVAPVPFGFAELDFQPEPWSVADALAVTKVVLFANQSAIEREILATTVTLHLPEFAAASGYLRPFYPVFVMPETDRPAPLSLADPPPPRLPTGTRKSIAPAAVAEALSRLREVMAPLDAQGSNNWAVSGAHTTNGRPLIANDPHQQMQSPSLMYALHINSAEGGGDLDVAGLAFAGAPGIHLGHNRHIAWTATNNFPDTMDLWEATLSTDGQVSLGGESLPLEARAEEIIVGGGDTVHFVVRELPGRGVWLPDGLFPVSIVTTREDSILWFEWVGFRPTRDALAFLGFMRARDMDDFEAAADLGSAVAFNVVAADASEIAYRVPIKLPGRGGLAEGQLPWQVMNGDDPATMWSDSMLPPAMMPRSRAPSRGYLATANNDPWGFTADGNVENDPWYYGAFFAPGFRAARIEAELGRMIERGGVSVEDFQGLQMDVHSPVADAILPWLAAAWETTAADSDYADIHVRPEVAVVAELLTQDWDGRMARDSAGAAAFQLLVVLLARDVLADDLGLSFHSIANADGSYLLKLMALALGDGDNGNSRIAQPGRTRLLMNALAATADELEARFGSTDPAGYVYSDLHGASMMNGHWAELDHGFVATDGGEDTVNPENGPLYAGQAPAERFDATKGPVHRIITGFDDDGVPRAVWNFALGNSEDRSSPHHADLLEDWVEGRYRPFYFRRDEVEAATESSTLLR